MEENKIIINSKNIFLKNNKINNYLNENINECLICYSQLNNDSIIMNNSFCKCYKNVLFCQECFINWYINDNKCFICHTKYISNNNHIIYDIKVPLLKYKLSNTINNLDKQYISTLINSESMEIENNNRRSSVISTNVIDIAENTLTPSQSPISSRREINIIQKYIYFFSFTAFTGISFIIYGMIIK